MEKGDHLMLFVMIMIVLIGLLYAGKITGNVTTAFNTCSDSDFGKTPFTKGTVEGKTYLFNVGALVENNYFEEDKCLGDTLLEYYCDSKDRINYNKRFVTYECNEGCQEGMCNPEIREELAAPKICNLFCLFGQWLRN